VADEELRDEGGGMAKRRQSTPYGPDAVLTAREAAKYLRLALPTFYRYMWEGKIPSSKIGGRYRFKKTILDRWLGKKPEGEEVSGRNKLVGVVSAIKRDAIMAQVNLDVGDHKITAVITRDALDELALKLGDRAVALIKATEVMVIKES
jgi:molybdopterin-binding protein